MTIALSALDTVRRKLAKSYLERRTWRSVAAEFGISPAMAWRIVMQGYEPHEAHIRFLLKLPALLPAPVCLKCGAVHVTKRCTANQNTRYHHDLFSLSASTLADLMIRLYDYKEPCMHEIYRFYAELKIRKRAVK